MVELDLRALDHRAKQARAAIGRGLLQIGILRHNLLAQQRAGLVLEQRPGAAAELAAAMRTPVAPTVAVGF